MYALSLHQMQSSQILSCSLLVSTTLKEKFSVVRDASFSDAKRNTLCHFSTSPGAFSML